MILFPREAKMADCPTRDRDKSKNKTSYSEGNKFEVFAILLIEVDLR